MRTSLRLGAAAIATLVLSGAPAVASAGTDPPPGFGEHRTGTIRHVVRHNTDRDGVVRRFEYWAVKGDRHTYRGYGELIDLPNYALFDYTRKVVDGRQIGTIVEHRTRTWYVHVSEPDPPRVAADELAAECSYSPGMVPDDGTCDYGAGEIRRDMQGPIPQLAAEGHELIDGRATVRLRDLTADRDEGVRRYLYADALTYELVRIERLDTRRRALLPRSVQDWRYLEPTAANRELLEPQIPEGYRKTADQTDRG